MSFGNFFVVKVLFFCLCSEGCLLLGRCFWGCWLVFSRTFNVGMRDV